MPDSSSRSDDLSLARPFKAGYTFGLSASVASATHESKRLLHQSLRDDLSYLYFAMQALKGLPKISSSLRDENRKHPTSASTPQVTFVVIDSILLKKRAKLFLKCSLVMVLTLLLNVANDFR
jgi:hypothetical protein